MRWETGDPLITLENYVFKKQSIRDKCASTIKIQLDFLIGALKNYKSSKISGREFPSAYFLGGDCPTSPTGLLMDLRAYGDWDGQNRKKY